MRLGWMDESYLNLQATLSGSHDLPAVVLLRCVEVASEAAVK